MEASGHWEEMDRLRSNLSLEQVEQAVLDWHGTVTRYDGSGRLAHFFAVSKLAVEHIKSHHGNQTLVDAGYWETICAASGLLHESMERGCSFEDVVEVADEAVASLVASISSDRRDPQPKRIRIYANRVGLADFHAQVVKLADLQHEYLFLSRFTRDREAALPFLGDVQLWVGEARQLTDSLGKIKESHSLTKPLRRLQKSLVQMDHFCRRKFQGELK